MRLMDVLSATGAVALFMTAAASAPEAGPDVLVVGVQEAGTVQWEIQTIFAHDLAETRELELEIRPLADSRAGQIALQAGEVDVILSDFVWVAIQRSAGNAITMVPHSLAVGALMAGAGSDIRSVADLEGKTIGVAGGPVDKSWVTLQAYYNSVTGETLTDAAKANFGAPPLVNELLAGGSVDAALNFWHWNARAKVAGATEVISVAEMFDALGVSAQPPLLGWTFTETTAREKKDALMKFLDASFEAKVLLRDDDRAWLPLRAMMGAEGDEALFLQLRDDYREGIVSAYDPTEMDAAEEAFALLAEYGGSDLVGETDRLDAGTFWQDYRK